MSSPLAAGQVDELAPVPVVRTTLDVEPLTPTKVSTTIVVDDSILRMSKPNAAAFLAAELRRAVAQAVDAAFLGMLVATGTPSSSSSGLGAAEFVNDLIVALGSIECGSDAALYLILPTSVCKTVALLRDSSGPLFPEMTVTGGTIQGIRVIVSDAATTDAILLDASQVAVSSDSPLLLDASIAAALEASDSPTLGEPAALVSMFQSGQAALRATRYFACTPLRATATATITGMVTS